MNDPLEAEILKCFTDSHMETEADTELFDIEETISKIADYIQADRIRVAREARIDELSSIPYEPNFLPEYIADRIAQLSTTDKQEGE